ncbi:YraN family protein [candidate division WOR-3 bacterium]|nr:YraN family protein [candidate division WOR-3 bacterium]
MNRQSLGKRGEEAAAEFLQNSGYGIITRNFYTRWGELDIIARDSEEIVFVEVRTRSTAGFMTPGESVDYAKQDRLRNAAQTWLSEHYPIEPPPCRFDVISVIIKKGQPPVIEHFTNAFQ